jgi:hypothetical protein
MAADGKYSDEEVRAIIDRALREQPNREVSHDELLDIASGVGISRDAIEAASREVQAAREDEQAKQQIFARRRKRLGSHVWFYVVVNLFVFAVNYLSTRGEWWCLYSILLWGLFLAFHVRFGLSKEVSERELRRQKRRMFPGRKTAELPGANWRAKFDFENKNLDQATHELTNALQERFGGLISRAAQELRQAGKGPGKVRVDATSPPQPEEEAPDVSDAERRNARR